MINIAKAPLVMTVLTVALSDSPAALPRLPCVSPAKSKPAVDQSQIRLHPVGSNCERTPAVGSAKSGSDGRFELRTEETPGEDVVLYVVAKGGVATVKKGSSDNPAITLLTVLGNRPPAKVVINELTTVASAFTPARFIKGKRFPGSARTADRRRERPNLVDPTTGGWGKVLLTRSTAPGPRRSQTWIRSARSITAFFTVADDIWRARFLKAATPTGGPTPEEHPRSNGRHRP